jgi:hypothetical protein
MKQNTSQSSEISYLKWGLIIALFSAVGTYLGLGVAYLSWQNPKAPNVEAQKLVSQQEAMSTPTSTPVPTPASVVPSPSVTPSPSPTPKVEAKQRKPRKSSTPQEEVVEGPCYTEGKGGEHIPVDCETGEEIDP